MTVEHSFKKGDILVNTWGWEQTNVDFFQVVGVTRKSVKIRELKQIQTPSERHVLIGKCVPVVGDFRNDEVSTKRVKSGYGDDEYVRHEYGLASKWNGNPVGYTAYA